MKKVLFFMAMFATMFIGCQNETDEPFVKENVKFTATFEKGDSRVTLDDDYANWEVGDLVSVFNEQGKHYQYKSDLGGSPTTTLSYTGSDDPTFDTDIHAIFPYNEANQFVNNTLYGELPADQEYGKAINNAIMVSKILKTDETFVFKNSCALVKLNINAAESVASENVFIQSISITSNEHQLAGKVKIENDFTATITEGKSNVVTLKDCESAGTLSSSAYLQYLVVIPAGEYVAGDLSVAIKTNNEKYDYTAQLKRDYTVGRSKYIELKTTLGPKISVDEDKETDKAIMTLFPNLYGQKILPDGFTYETLYAIPNDHLTIDGNGKTFTFKPIEYVGDGEFGSQVLIANTFTTSVSGFKNTTPYKITVNDLTIKGELRGTTMGIWGTEDQSTFDTEFNNVKILNNKVPHWSKEEGGALCTFGKAVLNNCEVTGTTRSDWDKNNPDVTDTPIYDMVVTNNSVTTLNGGIFDNIRVKEQGKLIVKNGATVKSIHSIIVSATTKGDLIIEDANVTQIIVDPTEKGSYNPTITISNQARIVNLRFVNVSNWAKAKVSIDDGAKIEEIVVVSGDNETVYNNIGEFKATVGL